MTCNLRLRLSLSFESHATSHEKKLSSATEGPPLGQVSHDIVSDPLEY